MTDAKTVICKHCEKLVQKLHARLIFTTFLSTWYLRAKQRVTQWRETTKRWVACLRHLVEQRRKFLKKKIEGLTPSPLSDRHALLQVYLNTWNRLNNRLKLQQQ